MTHSKRGALQRGIPLFLCLATLIPLALLPACRREPVTTKSEQRQLTAADGAQVPATFKTPITSPVAGLVLVHGKGENPEQWTSFETYAALEDFATITIALRQPLATAETEAQGVSPWVLAGYDIEAAHQSLLEEGIRPERIVLIGSGVGGSLALRYAAQEKRVPAAILLSPGLEYEELPLEAARAAYPGSLMMLYATGDAYAAASTRTLHEIAPGLSEVREYQGTAHGIILLNSSSHARSQMLHWIHVALGLETEIPVADTDYVPEWARSKK